MLFEEAEAVGEGRCGVASAKSIACVVVGVTSCINNSSKADKTIVVKLWFDSVEIQHSTNTITCSHQLSWN